MVTKVKENFCFGVCSVPLNGDSVKSYPTDWIPAFSYTFIAFYEIRSGGPQLRSGPLRKWKMILSGASASDTLSLFDVFIERIMFEIHIDTLGTKVPFNFPTRKFSFFHHVHIQRHISQYNRQFFLQAP